MSPSRRIGSWRHTRRSALLNRPPVSAPRDTAASHKQHLEHAAAADSAHRTELGKLQHVFKTAADLQAWQANPRCNLMAFVRVPADAEAVSTEQHSDGTIIVTFVRKQPVVRRGCARPGRGSDVPLPTAYLLSLVVPLWQKHCEGSGISAHFMLEALEKLPAFQDCPESLPTLAAGDSMWHRENNRKGTPYLAADSQVEVRFPRKKSKKRTPPQEADAVTPAAKTLPPAHKRKPPPEKAAGGGGASVVEGGIGDGDDDGFTPRGLTLVVAMRHAGGAPAAQQTQ